MSGQADANLSYDDVCPLLLRCGYSARRGTGSHCIFSKATFLNINLQNRNGKAKDYQVAQIRQELSKQNLP